MPRVDPETKQKILASPEFATWWKWRRTITPIPSDPFRAYMIDIGIPAKVQEYPQWQKRVNRGDFVNIDFPFPPTLPLPKRKIPLPSSGKPLHQVLKTKVKKRASIIKEAAKKFFEYYDLPPISISLSGKGYLRSRLRTRLTGKALNPKFAEGVSTVILGAGGKQKLPTLATLFHELGHYKIYREGVPKAFRDWLNPRKIKFAKTSEERLREERQAWEYAKPFLTHPTQHWLKRFALETYKPSSAMSIFAAGSTLYTEREAKAIKRMKGKAVKIRKVKRKGKLLGYRIYQKVK